jgi:hypothetical protein
MKFLRFDRLRTSLCAVAQHLVPSDPFKKFGADEITDDQEADGA